jgi:hypothetical protein
MSQLTAKKRVAYSRWETVYLYTWELIRIDKDAATWKIYKEKFDVLSEGPSSGS